MKNTAQGSHNKAHRIAFRQLVFVGALMLALLHVWLPASLRHWHNCPHNPKASQVKAFDADEFHEEVQFCPFDLGAFLVSAANLPSAWVTKEPLFAIFSLWLERSYALTALRLPLAFGRSPPR